MGGIKSNNLPAMIYIIFESINPATRVGVSNIKNEIDRATLDNFFNDIKDLLDKMPSGYTIIIDNEDHCKDRFLRLFRSFLTRHNLTLNCFIKITKDD